MYGPQYVLKPKPPTGVCGYHEERGELWTRRCPGNVTHVCPTCAMRNYCSREFKCPVKGCERFWSIEERQELHQMCQNDPNFSSFVGTQMLLGQNEAWCWMHGALIGVDAVAQGACATGTCVICKRCSKLYGVCYCQTQSQYVEPPDCGFLD